MNTLLVLQNRAIKAAQDERWDEAVTLNQDILKQDPENISAMNRLGFAYMQAQDFAPAKKTYNQVLKIDKTNAVARKYLAMLDSAKEKPVRLPKALKHSDFIDEPGKTKSVSLTRLADSEVLEAISIGEDCQFRLSKTRISVQCGSTYLGSLPDDLVSRLLPLVEAGNTYSIKVQSVKTNSLRVFIRETNRDASVEHIPSFPNDMMNVLTLDHAEVAREDELPVIVSETGEEDDANQMLENRDIDEALSKDDYLDDVDDDLEDLDESL